MGFTISIELLASATSFHLEVLAGKIVGATKRKNKEVCTTNSGLPNLSQGYNDECTVYLY